MAVLLAPAAPVFSVSGASSAGDGDTYTLTLTQTQGAPVQSWTINWGDGTIQTVPNTGPTVTHVYSGGTLSNAPDYQIVVTATADDGSAVYPSSAVPDVTVDLPDGDLVSPSSIPPVSFLEYDQEIEQPSAADDGIDLTQLFQDSNPLSYSVISNSDDTI